MGCNFIDDHSVFKGLKDRRSLAYSLYPLGKLCRRSQFFHLETQCLRAYPVFEQWLFASEKNAQGGEHVCLEIIRDIYGSDCLCFL